MLTTGGAKARVVLDVKQRKGGAVQHRVSLQMMCGNERGAAVRLVACSTPKSAHTNVHSAFRDAIRATPFATAGVYVSANSFPRHPDVRQRRLLNLHVGAAAFMGLAPACHLCTCVEGMGCFEK